MSDWARVGFRKWLRERVLDTAIARVCCVAVYEKRVDAVVTKTGLSATMVEEVGREYAKRVVAAGRAVPTGPKKSHRTYGQIHMDRVPDAVFSAWVALAERLHMRPSMALRVLLHEYLLGAEEPLHRDSRWVLDGHIVSGAGKHSIEPGVTQGALTALNVRAERLGLPRGHLVRCLMVDALAGRRRIGAPINRAVMYDDPKRYRS